MSEIAIAAIDLLIEREEVDEENDVGKGSQDHESGQGDASQENPENQRLQDTGKDLAQIDSVKSHDSQKCEEQPGQGVVRRPLRKTPIRLTIHRRNQKHVNQPANQKKSTGEEPQNTRLVFTEVEAMRAGKSKEAQEIPHQFAVGVVGTR